MDAAMANDRHSNRIQGSMQGIELNGKVGSARKPADRVDGRDDASPRRMNGSGIAAGRQIAEQP
jgi:hypothetical protein